MVVILCDDLIKQNIISLIKNSVREATCNKK